MKNEALSLLEDTLIFGISTGLGLVIGDTIQESQNDSQK